MTVKTKKELIEKWGAVLDHADYAPITNPTKRALTAQILENTQAEHAKAVASNGAPATLLNEAAPANATGAAIANYDPVLISMMRRTAPNLIGPDIMGTQAMTGPTGIVFAMRSRYTSNTGPEAFFNEANTAFAGEGTHAAIDAAIFLGDGVATNPSILKSTGNTMPTANAEALGTGATDFAEMAFSIEKVTVTAGSIALKAEYSLELAQDLKAIHGLDAETELSNMLTTEIINETNRRLVRSVNGVAVVGAAGTASAGTFDLDVDANGRWSVEKFKGLRFQLELEANAIAKATRRGRGNILIVTSDVASALEMAGVLDYNPTLAAQMGLNIDDTGSTYAGQIGKIKVYIDPYTSGFNYATMGYRGSDARDAGLFYCPYTPAQLVRAVNDGSFQPKLGFKARYGLVMNPFAKGLTAPDSTGSLVANSNVYYRKMVVTNIL